jgi:hypothetical protein
MTKLGKDTRGGAREGSGRHTIYDRPLIRMMFRIAPQHMDMIKSVNHKNINGALREILDDPSVQKAIQHLIDKRK